MQCSVLPVHLEDDPSERAELICRGAGVRVRRQRTSVPGERGRIVLSHIPDDAFP